MYSPIAVSSSMHQYFTAARILSANKRSQNLYLGVPFF